MGGMESTTTTQTVRLPRLWFEDAESRDLDIGRPVRWMARLVDVEMTGEQIAGAARELNGGGLNLNEVGFGNGHNNPDCTL